MAISRQPADADSVAAFHRPDTAERLEVPDLERSVRSTGQEVVTGRDGEASNIASVTLDVHTCEPLGFRGRSILGQLSSISGGRKRDRVGLERVGGEVEEERKGRLERRRG